MAASRTSSKVYYSKPMESKNFRVIFNHLYYCRHFSGPTYVQRMIKTMPTNTTDRQHLDLEQIGASMTGQFPILSALSSLCNISDIVFFYSSEYLPHSPSPSLCSQLSPGPVYSSKSTIKTKAGNTFAKSKGRTIDMALSKSIQDEHPVGFFFPCNSRCSVEFANL